MVLAGLLVGCVVGIEQSLVFDEPVERIEITLAGGDVEVEGGPADGPVRLEGTLAGPAGDAGGAHVVEGVLSLVVDCGACGGTVTLTAPPAVDLALATGAGSVRVAGMEGEVRAEAALGSIDVRGHGAGPVWLAARLGDVHLARELPGDVEITVETGDVDVIVPAGPWDLELAVTRGRAEVDPRVRADAAGPRLQVDLDAGDLAIRAR